MIHVRNLTPSNLDDVFKVCSATMPDDAVRDQGRALKRQWLTSMMQAYGPCTKLAYWGTTPIAQLLYYPERAVPFRRAVRPDVLRLHCLYSPFASSHRRGAATALLQALLQKCQTGCSTFDGRIPAFISARRMDSPEGEGLHRLYQKCGFQEMEQEYVLELHGTYSPRPPSDAHPCSGEPGQVLLFYDACCEWSWRFALGAQHRLRDMGVERAVTLLNSWDCPDLFSAYGEHMVVVNGVGVKTFWRDTDRFHQEVLEACATPPRRLNSGDSP